MSQVTLATTDGQLNLIGSYWPNKHGAADTSEQNLWRCLDRYVKGHKERDMGDCPEGGTIERIDGKGNYSPTNCKWASRVEQANNKSNNKFYTAHGKTQTLAMWANEIGCTSHAIRLRIKHGMSVEEAVSKPVPERPNSKLTMDQARTIRAGYPMLSAQKLAAQYGVCKKSVLNILHNKTFVEGVT